MNTILSYSNATQLLEQGRAKDAYTVFLSVVESSTQQLHGVKFVQQTIVSKPLQYDDSIALLRSCLDQLEKIVIHNMTDTVPKLKSSPPPVPPKPSAAATTTTTTTTTTTATATTIIQKPMIPPKPNTSYDYQQQKLNMKRSRDNSVSFAKDSKLSQMMTVTKNSAEEFEEELTEDEDESIEFENIFNHKRNEEVQVLKTRGRSKSCTVENNLKEDLMQVLSETVIDPRQLAPAQTNTGDSLTIPTISQINEYVPNIPVPPLLSTHRRLQQQLNELESNAKGKDSISCIRHLLEKVRTLYMSAMTIPNILHFSPQLVAYQLTLIESSIFRAIPSNALLSHSTRTPHKKIVASTDFFNFMTRSIEHSILLPQEASRRAEIIQRWIKIANKLLVLHNYHTLKTVVSALGTPPIKRLRRTWECIPKRRTARLDYLNSLMSESDNYCRYRLHIGLERKRIWSNPIVPFLGVFIHDITYLLAATKNPNGDLRVKGVLDKIQLFQSSPPYPHQPPSTFIHTPPKRHLFRRPTMSDALHFVGSRKSNHVMTMIGEDYQGIEIELEQQLIIQYVLMRPWVSERTIDALSSLREPSKPRSISSPTTSRYSNGSSNSSSIEATVMNTILSPVATTLPANNHTISASSSTSLLSNASSFMRFNSGHGHDDDVVAVEDQHIIEVENKRSIVGGFWPFRKSNDMSRHSIQMNQTEINQQEQTWSEEDEEEEDEEDEEDEDDDDDDEDEEDSGLEIINKNLQQQQEEDTSKQIVSSKMRNRSIVIYSKSKGHNRSLSLPSKSSIVTDLYPH